MTTSANDGAIAAAVAGLGIAATGVMGCRAELASGTLVRVLDLRNLGAVEINVVHPATRAAKLAARAFVDHLIEGLHPETK